MSKGLLIDLDGVLYQDGNAIPGAVEVVQWLQEKQIAHLFVTNTTSRPRQMITEKLRSMGMDIPEGNILTPPVAACEWLTANRKQTAILFVPEVTKEDFKNIEILDSTSAEKADAIVIGDLGKNWTFEILNRAFRLLMDVSQPTLLALGMTRYWKTAEGLQLDVGPFVKSLEYASGCEAIVVGKPSPTFFTTALEMLGYSEDNAVMIGDDVVGDIQSAQHSGIQGVLVRTGKFRESDLQGDVHPDGTINSIAEFPEWFEKHR